MKKKDWINEIYQVAKSVQASFNIDDWIDLHVPMKSGKNGYISIGYNEDYKEVSIEFEKSDWNLTEQLTFVRTFYYHFKNTKFNFYFFVSGLKEEDADDTQGEENDHLLGCDFRTNYRGIPVGESATKALSVLKELNCIRSFYNNEIELEEKLYDRKIFLHPDAENGNVKLHFQESGGWSEKKGEYILSISSKEELDNILQKNKTKEEEFVNLCEQNGFTFLGTLFKGIPMYKIRTQTGEIIVCEVDEIASEKEKEEALIQSVKESKEKIKKIIQERYPNFSYDKTNELFASTYVFEIFPRYPNTVIGKFFQFQERYDSTKELEEAFRLQWTAMCELDDKLSAIKDKPYATWDVKTRTIRNYEGEQTLSIKLIPSLEKSITWDVKYGDQKIWKNLQSTDAVAAFVEKKLKITSTLREAMYEIRDWLYREIDYVYVDIHKNNLRYFLFNEEHELDFEVNGDDFFIGYARFETAEELKEWFVDYIKRDYTKNLIKHVYDPSNKGFLQRFKFERGYQWLGIEVVSDLSSEEIVSILEEYYENKKYFIEPKMIENDIQTFDLLSVYCEPSRMYVSKSRNWINEKIKESTNVM